MKKMLTILALLGGYGQIKSACQEDMAYVTLTQENEAVLRQFVTLDLLIDDMRLQYGDQVSVGLRGTKPKTLTKLLQLIQAENLDAATCRLEDVDELSDLVLLSMFLDPQPISYNGKDIILTDFLLDKLVDKIFKMPTNQANMIINKLNSDGIVRLEIKSNVESQLRILALEILHSQFNMNSLRHITSVLKKLLSLINIKEVRLSRDYTILAERLLVFALNAFYDKDGDIEDIMPYFSNKSARMYIDGVRKNYPYLVYNDELAKSLKVVPFKSDQELLQKIDFRFGYLGDRKKGPVPNYTTGKPDLRYFPVNPKVYPEERQVELDPLPTNCPIQ